MTLFYKLCTIVPTQSAVHFFYILFCNVNWTINTLKRCRGRLMSLWAKSWTVSLLSQWSLDVLHSDWSPLPRKAEGAEPRWNPPVESGEALGKGNILGSQLQENSTWSINCLQSASMQICSAPTSENVHWHSTVSRARPLMSVLHRAWNKPQPKATVKTQTASARRGFLTLEVISSPPHKAPCVSIAPNE